MTIKFAPHIRHVADQQRDADLEYEQYELGLQRIEAHLGIEMPRIPRDHYEDMRDLLAARMGVDE